ncbi:MAG: hypothetical protein ACXWV6_01480 [Chitinophagaceae bacterium]
MKQLTIICAFLLIVVCLSAQNYPEPEFSNEVYYLKKDSAHSVVRLEKASAKMDNKVKAAGFGGYENGYVFDGDKSNVRFSKGVNLSFVFSNGNSVGTRQSSQQQDSIMRANGMDPSAMSGMAGGMDDPARNITLYKTDVTKGKRKIYMMKTGGAFSMGKNKSSDKYTFSVKKIREGYWELFVDKPLPKGEYAFAVMAGYSGSGGMDALLYAFAVD